ncbi:hypothetical protein IFR05_000801 [Cadophora sp. M221]|nr:hypothetical protein IFR05_000801 [Cadophora sp. M221]
MPVLKVADFDQTHTFPSPPPLLADAFSKTLTWLTPGGGAPFGRDKSMFYSGSSDENDIFDLHDTFAEDKKLTTQGASLKTMQKPNWTRDEVKASGFRAGYLDGTFIRFMSAAFARASTGKVYVMLPEEGMRSRNVWTEFEWPELVSHNRNAGVTHIIWVSTDMKTTKILWIPSDGAIPFPMKKPISEIGH